MTTTTPPEPIRAFHLTSFEHAISNISLRRLKVARFSEVNDPFELAAMNCMKRETRRALGAFKEEQDRTLGLLSFSERWKNPVLWSHYATGGRGIALGFDIKPSFGTRGVLKVKYEDSKLKALGDDPDAATISKEFQDLLFVTKYEHWRYEEELRVIVKLSDATREDRLFFYPFSDDLCLKEVIVGPLCSGSLVEQIRTATHATNPGAKVSRARLGFKWFEVKPHELHPPK